MERKRYAYLYVAAILVSIVSGHIDGYESAIDYFNSEFAPKIDPENYKDAPSSLSFTDLQQGGTPSATNDQGNDLEIESKRAHDDVGNVLLQRPQSSFFDAMMKRAELQEPTKFERFRSSPQDVIDEYLSRWREYFGLSPQKRSQVKLQPYDMLREYLQTPRTRRESYPKQSYSEYKQQGFQPVDSLRRYFQEHKRDEQKRESYPMYKRESYPMYKRTTYPMYKRFNPPHEENTKREFTSDVSKDELTTAVPPGHISHALGWLGLLQNKGKSTAASDASAMVNKRHDYSDNPESTKFSELVSNPFEKRYSRSRRPPWWKRNAHGNEWEKRDDPERYWAKRGSGGNGHGSLGGWMTKKGDAKTVDKTTALKRQTDFETAAQNYVAYIRSQLYAHHHDKAPSPLFKRSNPEDEALIYLAKMLTSYGQNITSLDLAKSNKRAGSMYFKNHFKNHVKTMKYGKSRFGFGMYPILKRPLDDIHESDQLPIFKRANPAYKMWDDMRAWLDMRPGKPKINL